MAIELNQRLFRRLVQLELLVLALFVAILAFEMIIDPKWVAFDTEFHLLVDRHFGEVKQSDGWVIAQMVAMIMVVAWFFASTIGLFWFRRWARFGFWAAGVVAMMIIFLIDGYRPNYGSSLYDVFALLDGMLLGAILILAYSRDHGARWFNTAPLTPPDIESR